MKKILLSLAVLGLFVAGGGARAAVSTYTVQRGDTLCGIGAKFGVSCKDMVVNFSGKNPNLIHPGDKFEFGQPDGLLGGLISKPYTFAPNTVIYSSQVNSDFDTLYTLVNGNLNNANIVAGAAISSTKISGTAIVSTGAASQSINGTTTVFGSLYVSSTIGFFRVPIMTTAQRDALEGVEPGAIIYSTDAGQFFVREGSSWAAISPAAATALANSSTKGIVQEATTSSILTGTQVGSTGARNFLSVMTVATTSDYSSTMGRIVATRADSQIDSSFCGNPGSCAQLNANQKVVQNPASATSTPGITSTIPITSSVSGTLPITFLASSTGDGVRGDFIRSTSTGPYYGTVVESTGVSTTASRALDTAYQNTSTVHNGKTLYIVIDVALNPATGATSYVDVFVGPTASPTTLVARLRTYNNNSSANGITNNNLSIGFFVPPNGYWKLVSSGTVVLNNIFEQEI